MKKILLATSVALALVSSSAFAVTQQSGVYIGALGGWSFSDSPSSTTMNDQLGVSGITTSDKNYTWGATLGYQYAFTRNWAAGLEVSYLNFGKTEYNTPGISDVFTVKNNGVQIMAMGSYLMNNGFNVFGKAGAINQETEGSSSLVNNTGSTTKWIPALAAGVGYMPLQNLNIALQYEHTFGDDYNNSGSFNNSGNKPMNQNAVTLGVSYVFPLSF